MKKINCISLLITISFLTLIGWFSCCNYQILMKPVSDFIDQRTSIRKLNTGSSQSLAIVSGRMFVPVLEGTL